MKSLLVFLAALAVPSFCAAASPAASTVLVRPRRGATSETLFARVEPVHVLAIRAASTGILKNLKVRPGDRVRVGERLAHLGGPTYKADLESSRAGLKAAQKTARLARDRLQATRSRYPVLSSRISLDRAKQKMARAVANLVNAQAQFRALETTGVIVAPVAGTVSDVSSSNGERIVAGQPIMDIHPAGSLWLRGTVYGKAVGTVHTGMRGSFEPTGGGVTIPVRVTRLIPADVNNGVGIAFVATTQKPQWFDGESGLVILQSQKPAELAVPTRALVLDHGRWWVIEKMGSAFRPVRVKPAGTRDGWTWIAAGLKPGERVVSKGAYRIFHRDFSRQYGGG